MQIFSSGRGLRAALLLVPAVLALLPAGCINELAERGGPRSRYDAATPAAFPTIAATRRSNDRVLTPAEQAKEEAELKAKAAAAQRGAGPPVTAKQEDAAGKALKSKGASHGADALATIDKNCRNPASGQAAANCPQ